MSTITHNYGKALFVLVVQGDFSADPAIHLVATIQTAAWGPKYLSSFKQGCAQKEMGKGESIRLLICRGHILSGGEGT